MLRKAKKLAKPVELSDEEIASRVAIARRCLAHRARIQATFNTAHRAVSATETRMQGLGDYAFTGLTCVAILATLATVGTLTKPRHEIVGDFPSAFAYLPPPPTEPEKPQANPWDKIEATRAAEFKQERKVASMKKAQDKLACEKFGSHCQENKRAAAMRAKQEARAHARELCELFDVGCKRKSQ